MTLVVGIAEMALSGTTTFNDMYLLVDCIIEVASRAGMRVALGEPLMDVGDGK